VSLPIKQKQINAFLILSQLKSSSANVDAAVGVDRRRVQLNSMATLKHFGRVTITRKIIRKLFCRICMEPCSNISKLKVHLDQTHNIKVPEGPPQIDTESE
jgi:RNase P subunit RPR2